MLGIVPTSFIIEVPPGYDLSLQSGSKKKADVMACSNSSKYNSSKTTKSELPRATAKDYLQQLNNSLRNPLSLQARNLVPNYA